LEARITRDMAEKKDVIVSVKAVLALSIRLLKRKEKSKKNLIV
jgi:hypothetical protein